MVCSSRMWMSRGLALVFWLMRDRRSATAAEHGVLVSSLLFESASYSRRAIANLVAFTSRETPIMVHISANEREDRFLEVTTSEEFTMSGRVHLNPVRLATHHGSGSILLGHLLNARRGSELGLNFSYVILSSSKSRFFLPGVEAVVARAQYSLVTVPTWLRRTYCDSHKKKTHRFFFDALYGRNQTVCGAGFSTHEGAFFPKRVVLAFLHWLEATEVPRSDDRGEERTSSAYERVLSFTSQGGGGQGFEEIYLQSYVLAAHRAAYDAARKAPPLCAHEPPRWRQLDATDAIARRLGFDASKRLGPLQLKRWGDDDAYLDCLAAGDALALRTSDDERDANVRLQKTTLDCLTNVSLPRHFDRAPDVETKRATSLFGSEDPYPDLKALKTKVVAWLAEKGG